MDYYANLLMRPLGAYQISSWLTDHGYTVKVIDFCHQLTTNQLVDITLKHTDKNTIGVGVSSTFWKTHAFTTEDKKLSIDYHEPNWVINARIQIEAKHKHLKWVLGGANAGYFKQSKFDWVVLTGYSEDGILKFLNETSGKKSQALFDISNQRSAFVNTSIQSHEVLPIEIGRGCQFKCNFCRFALLGKKKNSYMRNFCLVEQELRENYDKFGVTRYIIVDDTVNESEEKITALAEIAQRLPFKFEWVGYNRLDIIGSKQHTMSILKDSGLKSAYFGIESFHVHGSKVAGKPWIGKHGKDFLLKLKEYWGKDINFFLSFIIGLGNETPQDIMDTHKWCIENGVSSWIFHPLSMSRHPDVIFPSVFDLNYTNYGYRFPDPLDDYYWENDTWNFKSAKEFVEPLSQIIHKEEKPASFFLASLASTTGKSFDELINTTRKELDWYNIKITIESFLQEYAEQNLKQ
jgi:hypothetical protein